MKCICLAGAVQADLEMVFSLLQQAGVKLPLVASDHHATRDS